jgi:hypothetical protein
MMKNVVVTSWKQLPSIPVGIPPDQRSRYLFCIMVLLVVYTVHAEETSYCMSAILNFYAIQFLALLCNRLLKTYRQLYFLHLVMQFSSNSFSNMAPFYSVQQPTFCSFPESWSVHKFTDSLKSWTEYSRTPPNPNAVTQKLTSRGNVLLILYIGLEVGQTGAFHLLGKHDFRRGTKNEPNGVDWIFTQSYPTEYSIQGEWTTNPVYWGCR